MTENQARDAKRLVEELDCAKRLTNKIHEQFRKAKSGDKDATEWLANACLELNGEHVRFIERDIAAL